MSNHGYQPGVWSAICDVCGFEYKSYQLKKRWDGYMVCSKDWEPRHPQEFVKDKPSKALPWTRPEAPDTFVSVTYVASNIGTQENTIPSGTNNNSL